jgi:hypothetical protein
VLCSDKHQHQCLHAQLRSVGMCIHNQSHIRMQGYAMSNGKLGKFTVSLLY